MSLAYRDDISGQLFEGEGKKSFEFNVAPACRLRVIPLQSKNGKAVLQGEIHPDQAEKIIKAVQGALGYVEPEPVENKKA